MDVGRLPEEAPLRGAVDAPPHHFAWQYGWDEMVAAAALACHAMPPEEQARVAVVGNDCGDSGAVDLLGPKYGLPLKALGTHQSYWLWGLGRAFAGLVWRPLRRAPPPGPRGW